MYAVVLTQLSEGLMTLAFISKPAIYQWADEERGFIIKVRTYCGCEMESLISIALITEATISDYE